MHKIHLLMKRQGKDEYRTVYGPVPNRLPVIRVSTRSHDKTVETADNPVYDVLFFCCFFCKQFFFFFVFSREFQNNSIKSVQCAAGFFSMRPP